MRLLGWIPLVAVLIGIRASADVTDTRATDRVLIERSIALLNDPSQRSTVFAPQSEAASQFERIRKSRPGAVIRFFGPSDDYLTPSVNISREPWGEATFTLPSENGERGKIVFVDSHVALAEGFCIFGNGEGPAERQPLLFVMRKDGGTWKIASLRAPSSFGALQPKEYFQPSSLESKGPEL